jgi:hypothetical protein
MAWRIPPVSIPTRLEIRTHPADEFFVNFSKAPVSSEAVLKLIARVPAGREILAEFMPMYRAGRVVFEPYADALLARLRAALGEGQPVGACFVCDGVSGQIHFDPTAPIGVLAPFLVHEMAHAVDTSLWVRTNARKSRVARDRIMLDAETRAFALQHRFVEELREADVAYAEFLLGEQARVRVLVERLSERDIAELYGVAS